jgi:hypothetical protein
MLADRAFTLVDVQAILRESLVTEVAVLEVDKPAAVAVPEEVGDVPNPGDQHRIRARNLVSTTLVGESVSSSGVARQWGR